VIDNSGDRESLQRQVDALWSELQTLVAESSAT
jgi:hypothetical protein